jgi:exopolyphosphatase/guanosine-5'-triphosphate,3'-diphosphate pyrophosphatase
MVQNRGKQTKQIAVIDLGSNTARLIVMRAIPGYAYRLDDEIREVVRLRQGMTPRGLDEEAVQRALFALRLFKRFCDSRQVDAIIATTTSAVREAANGQLFVERVRREIGLDLQVLDGEQEAYYATLGALNEVPMGGGYVIDIGGGSAQISQVAGRTFRRGEALPLGALALTERFVDEDPVSEETFATVERAIEQQLDRLAWFQPLADGEVLTGLGGTIRNLAKIEARRQGFPLNTLHGFILSRKAVSRSITLFREMPLAERSDISGLSKDRADIILPGAMVLDAILCRAAADEIVVSVNGLREGLFLERFWDHLSYPVVGDVRRFGVLNLARIYRYQKNHANHVRYLAGRLFDELQGLHGYGPAERRLLEAAALLHDLGTIINYDDHHKHSETLIANSGLPGFATRETALIALLARYHRKGNPTLDSYANLAAEGDDVLLQRLAAILRLAEFMERGRNATVDDVAVHWDEHTLTLTLIAVEYPAVELWETERNAVELVAAAFNRTVVLESTAAPDTEPGP